MVFYFREKTTSYILISFFLFSGCSKPREGGKKGSPRDATASHVVSINSSIQNPLLTREVSSDGLTTLFDEVILNRKSSGKNEVARSPDQEIKPVG